MKIASVLPALLLVCASGMIGQTAPVLDNCGTPFHPVPCANASTGNPVVVTNPVSPVTAQPVEGNPASLLCNIARMAPQAPDFVAPPPLDLDAAIAAGQVKYCPSCYPYPVTPFAGPYAPAAWAANFQCLTDWQLITQIAGVQQSLHAPITAGWAQGLATQFSDALVFGGVTYLPDPMPFKIYCSGPTCKPN